MTVPAVRGSGGWAVHFPAPRQNSGLENAREHDRANSNGDKEPRPLCVNVTLRRVVCRTFEHRVIKAHGKEATVETNMCANNAVLLNRR